MATAAAAAAMVGGRGRVHSEGIESGRGDESRSLIEESCMHVGRTSPAHARPCPTKARVRAGRLRPWASSLQSPGAVPKLIGRLGQRRASCQRQDRRRAWPSSLSQVAQGSSPLPGSCSLPTPPFWLAVAAALAVVGCHGEVVACPSLGAAERARP